ncbi:helix-turn-helix domain-containing protein [Bifidobacterium avesanii]|uniref:Helix-turn-helix domain-containing protein n=1 Tax=Bifidobacterium avesanii TaxID=1798157 RepID=A0A7K3THF1_9BIFI|nr:helix-turn-helix transcriptional regulator [Bifidobacterium avesanii]KAB8294539.1 hypothetical protein DSM100685_0332 [Bifidobacterium avesanii]NEG78050.1 hypothetical protein [Bifidobacterium avesanii]
MTQTQTTDAPISTFGQRLQRCRKTQKIGAEKLAELVNEEYGEGTTTRSVITAIETGRKLEGVTMGEVLRFAHVLKVSPLCLMIDLEQPFLRADFPGFDGLLNYQAMRRFTGHVSFAGTIPDFMEKAQRVGIALDDATYRHLMARKHLEKLRQIESMPEFNDKCDTELVEDIYQPGEYIEVPNAAELAQREHTSANIELWDAWKAFLDDRKTLDTLGVIFPEDTDDAVAKRFTEEGVEKLRREIAPYEIVTTSSEAHDMWGDQA